MINKNINTDTAIIISYACILLTGLWVVDFIVAKAGETVAVKLREFEDVPMLSKIVDD